MKIFQNMEYSGVNPPKQFDHNIISYMILFYAWFDSIDTECHMNVCLH